MKTYDTYLFDWDGTLARTIEVWMQEIVHWCNEYGLGVTIQDIAPHFGDWKTPLHFGLPEAKLEEFDSHLITSVHTKLPEAQLYPGARAMLDRLKVADKKVALITATQRDSLAMLMESHDLAQYFGIIVTGEDVQAHKPNPEGLYYAMDQLGADPATTVMLGDTGKDLGAAQRANIDSVLFYPPTHEAVFDLAHLQTFNPTYTIHDWSELQV